MLAVLRLFWQRLWHLCRKELLTILKDPSSRAILIAPALMQSLIFGYAATHDLTHVPYALLDLSHSAVAADLVARVEGTGIFRRAVTLRSPADIAEVVNTGTALLVLHIPHNFARKVNLGGSVPVQVIVDGRNSTTAGLALAYVSGIVSSFNAAFTDKPVLTVETRAWFNPNLQTRWNMLPGLIAALSMIQTLLLASLSVAREREQGTFDQLLVTPLSPLEILLGKAVPPVLIGLVQSGIILLVCLFWFQIPMAGSVVLLFGGLFVFTLACVGLGLSISALSLNMQQAMVWTFALIMPLMLLSGLTTPLRSMSPFLQRLSYGNPLRFAVDMTRRVYLEGAGFSDVAFDFVPMLAVAAITLPLAVWLFRNRLA